METPALVYDSDRIMAQLSLLRQLARTSDCTPIYSIKSLPSESVLEMVSHSLNSVSVSSVYEARWAREVLGQQAELHMTTPGLNIDDIDEIAGLCQYVNFNSLQQMQSMSALLADRCTIGLRLNPQISELEDPRYDPCRPYSKLGIPLAELCAYTGELAHVKGLHFHTSFAAESFKPLQTVLAHFCENIPELMEQVDWLNIGGGYLFSTQQELAQLAEIIQPLADRFKLRFYFEPGKAVVGDAAYLVSTVVDRFEREGKQVAVLDTSVNHLPEVFEYQRAPQILNAELADTQANNTVLLVGCTCLSGDVFGEYCYSQGLTVGDRILFSDVGAYTLVKANRFNGYPLPRQYLLQPSGELILQNRDSYENYRDLWRRQ